MNKADITRSKRLSLALRHRPDPIGIEFDEHGWTPLAALLEALARTGPPITRDDLERVVRYNDKQRFELDLDRDRIRARQGHSVSVDLALEPATAPGRCRAE